MGSAAVFFLSTLPLEALAEKSPLTPAPRTPQAYLDFQNALLADIAQQEVSDQPAALSTTLSVNMLESRLKKAISAGELSLISAHAKLLLNSPNLSLDRKIALWSLLAKAEQDQGDAAQALYYQGQYVQANPSQESLIHYLEIRRRIPQKSKSYDELLALAAKAFPDHPRVIRLQFQSQLSKGNLSGALKWWRAQQMSEGGEAWCLVDTLELARFAMQNLYMPTALEAVNFSVAHYPKDSRGWMTQGELNYLLGRYEDSFKSYLQAFKLGAGKEASSSAAVSMEAWILKLLHQNRSKPQQYLVALRRVLDKLPSYLQLQQSAGSEYVYDRLWQLKWKPGTPQKNLAWMSFAQINEVAAIYMEVARDLMLNLEGMEPSFQAYRIAQATIALKHSLSFQDNQEAQRLLMKLLDRQHRDEEALRLRLAMLSKGQENVRGQVVKSIKQNLASLISNSEATTLMQAERLVGKSLPASSHAQLLSYLSNQEKLPLNQRLALQKRWVKLSPKNTEAQEALAKTQLVLADQAYLSGDRKGAMKGYSLAFSHTSFKAIQTLRYAQGLLEQEQAAKLPPLDNLDIKQLKQDPKEAYVLLLSIAALEAQKKPQQAEQLKQIAMTLDSGLQGHEQLLRLTKQAFRREALIQASLAGRM